MTERQGNPAGVAQRQYVVFLGKAKLTYHEAVVKARRILEDGGARPAEEFVLEQLKGESGQAVKEYEPGEDVPLDRGAKHFRAVPRGGGRA